ncbi:saccharopine dehydrogenase family protein [Lysobacter fragariae]
MQWMIYGANGYTGRLIAAEAVKRGLQPVLAGRNEAALRAMAEELGLRWRLFGLELPDAVREGLRDIDLVLHCAGPFSATCAPMLEGCLAARTHYLDITGEIDVFAHCHAQHARAQEAGIVVAPGVGFDVVPSDCLAAQLHRDNPWATSLVLGFEGGGGFSPGTAKTSVEGLGYGGRVRVNGELMRVPLAYKTRTFTRDGVDRMAMTIPWGDVYTAYVSTGIPDIEVYTTASPKTIAGVRRLRLLGPLLRTKVAQRFLKGRVEASIKGPDEATRASTQSHFWGEVRGNGRAQVRRMVTPNGYALTVTASLGIVDCFLQNPAPAPGYYTPSQLMGPDYVLELPGVAIEGPRDD